MYVVLEPLNEDHNNPHIWWAALHNPLLQAVSQGLRMSGQEMHVGPARDPRFADAEWTIYVNDGGSPVLFEKRGDE